MVTSTVTFFLIVNAHFWNYYVPSCAYVRETPFKHLESTSSELTFPNILSHNCHLLSLFAVNTTEQRERRADPTITLFSPTSPPPRHHTPPPNTYSLPRQSAHTCCAISRRCALLEECFPCVSRNALTLFFLRYCHVERGRGGDIWEEEEDLIKRRRKGLKRERRGDDAGGIKDNDNQRTTYRRWAAGDTRRQ